MTNVLEALTASPETAKTETVKAETAKSDPFSKEQLDALSNMMNSVITHHNKKQPKADELVNLIVEKLSPKKEQANEDPLAKIQKEFADYKSKNAAKEKLAEDKAKRAELKSLVMGKVVPDAQALVIDRLIGKASLSEAGDLMIDSSDPSEYLAEYLQTSEGKLFLPQRAANPVRSSLANQRVAAQGDDPLAELWSAIT